MASRQSLPAMIMHLAQPVEAPRGQTNSSSNALSTQPSGLGYLITLPEALYAQISVYVCLPLPNLQPLDLAGARKARGYTGVIGPFDADCLKAGATPVFKGIPMPDYKTPDAFKVCVLKGRAGA